MNIKKIVLTIIFLGVFVSPFLINIPQVQALTTEEILAQIKTLQEQITQLQKQLKEVGGEEVAWCHNFNVNLRIGDSGDEVSALNNALLKEGFDVDYTLSSPSSYFSEKTASAVTGFQEKYKEDVLTSWGLIHGTGFVGGTTRAKLNELYGCGAVTPATTKSITVTSPNGGEEWMAGNNYDIQWQSSRIDKVNIYISCDEIVTGGGCLKLVEQDINASLGKYAWQIKSSDTCVPGNNVKIWIKAKEDITIDDESDNYFTVVSSSEDCHSTSLWDWDYCSADCKGDAGEGDCDVDADCNTGYCAQNVGGKYGQVGTMDVCEEKEEVAPSITIISPNGGEKWTFGSTYNITWNSTDVDKVDIHLEKWAGDNGQVYAGGPFTQIIDENISAWLGWYSWPLGHLKGGSIASAGNYYKIRIVKTGDASSYSQQIADNSNNYFDIVSAPSTSVTCVRETTKTGVTCGGYFYEDYCENLADGTGYATKRKCNAATGTNCSGLVNVDRTFCPYGCQSGACLTQPTPSITVTSPNGGENWIEGQTYNITWESTEIDKVMIELEKESQGWHLTYSVSASQGYYSWTIGDLTPASNYKINIWDTENTSISDKSDNYFSIVEATTTTCHNSDLWSWDYCSPTCQCSAGEGDCDRDSDCNTGYCAQNVGGKYGQVGTMDVCEEKEVTTPSITSFNYTETDAYSGSVKFSWTTTRADNVRFSIPCHSGLTITNAVTGANFSCGENDRKFSTNTSLYLKFTNTSGALINTTATLTPVIGEVNYTVYSDSLDFGIVEVVTTCTDSDEGKDYYVKGTVTWTDENGVQRSSTDGCRYDGVTLAEVYCGDNPDIAKQYICPNGCSNGACVKIPATVNVTSPNGGEKWILENTYDIAWSSQGVKAFTIYLVGGGRVREIGRQIPASPAKYSYTPSSVGVINIADDYKIRMTTYQLEEGYTYSSDESDNYFSIVSASQPDLTIDDIYYDGPSYIKVKYCNKGTGIGSGDFLIKLRNETTSQEYPGNSYYRLSVPAVGTCTVTGGFTCGLIGVSCGNYAKVSATIDWENRVQESNENNNQLVKMIGEQPSMTSFNLTETDAYGGSIKFSWTSSGGDGVELQMSCHSGFTINDAVTGENFFCGDVDRSLSPNGSKYLKFINISGSPINVTATSAPVINHRGYYTYSKTLNFSIATSAVTPSITVTSPNGEEQWVAGQAHEITWNSSGIDKVVISICAETPLLTTKYSCWELPAMGYGINANLGKYSWSIDPNAPYVPGEVKIKISNYIDSSIYDESDNYFSIAAQTQPLGLKTIEDQLASISEAIANLLKNAKELLK